MKVSGLRHRTKKETVEDNSLQEKINIFQFFNQ